MTGDVRAGSYHPQPARQGDGRTRDTPAVARCRAAD